MPDHTILAEVYYEYVKNYQFLNIHTIHGPEVAAL